MAKSHTVAVVIPAFNEEATIVTVIKELPTTMRINHTNYNISVVVVDDSSTDQTAAKAGAAGAIVISHILNSGSGSATASGLSYAQQNGFDMAATLDADGQHKSIDLIKGIQLLNKKGGDLLIGSRLINTDGMSKVKVVGNKGLSFITYLLFGISVTDSQSGMRIFSKKALEQLRWKTSGYEFCSEMLWRAKQLGLEIKEYPIQAVYTEYSKSKGQSNWNALNIVRSLLKRRILELIGE